MKKFVLFIHGAGEGAYEDDRQLAASLQDALGADYEVHYPRMRNEASPEYADWKPQITSELAALDGEVTPVGHFVGGSVLIKYLSEMGVEKPIASLFLLAAPYRGADEFWKWDEVRLPEDVAAKLASIPRKLYPTHEFYRFPLARFTPWESSRDIQNNFYNHCIIGLISRWNDRWPIGLLGSIIDERIGYSCNSR